MGLLISIVRVCAVLLVWVCLPGCQDPDAAEKAAIRATLRQLDEANEACDGAAAVAVMSSEGLAEYTRLVKLALDAPREKVLVLGSSDKQQIIQLRNRLTRRELEKMDGAAYQQHATGECWYSMGEDYEGYEASIGKIDVMGDMAYAHILDEDGKDSGLLAEFSREDGVWKVNEFSFHRQFDEWTREWASLEGMTDDELLVRLEEIDWGKDVRDSIWDPMR
jgi:hypothetical protein